MFRILYFPIGGLIAAASLLVAHAAPVDDLRLRDAKSEGSNWLSYGRDYANQRFSPLNQINRDSVAKLVPRWIYQTGTNVTFQATPLVVDGVMYLSMPFNHVAALDAATGRELWRYEHKRKSSKMCCGPANRGVAVAYGKVFLGTVDSRLIALDAVTGQVVWDIPLATDFGLSETPDQLALTDALRGHAATGATGVGANMAPLAFDGKIIIGITGVGYGLHLEGERPNAPLGAVVGFSGNYGRPGFFAAFDAATGRRVWQFDTIAKSNWQGAMRATTADGVALQRDIAREQEDLIKYPDAAKHGGGSAWTTPAFDPQTGTLFVGIGNPSPQMDDVSRPGDNLYTVSLAALDSQTGKLKWYYQQVPHDIWGYDVASPPVLFDLPTDKEIIPAVGHASKMGWLYVHDRRTGELLYKSEPFVPQINLFARPTAVGVRIAPGALGGSNWTPVAFSPDSGLVYVAASHSPTRYTVHEIAASDAKPVVRYSSLEPVNEPNWGTLTAISTRERGRIRWQQKTILPMVGGVLATAGGLVFTGEGTGFLRAFDAENGAPLWQFQCGAGVNAPPISYQIDGTQYIAVAAGGNANFGFKQGGALVVFALPTFK